MDTKKTIRKVNGLWGGHGYLMGAFLLFFGLLSAPVLAQDEGLWYRTTPQEGVTLRLYFFWSSLCPHCDAARPLVERYAQQHPWLELQSLEVSASPENRERYRMMAAALGAEARSVPAFFYCGGMEVGLDAAQGVGPLFSGLERCRESLQAGMGMVGPLPSQGLPLGLQRGELGLTALTVMIAALDAFNPCAFFVLLFLLGMLSHARSRGRMVLVGATFVFFSGLLYFLFMSAWLNLFLLIGVMRPVTITAALLALLAAGINIKDALRPGQGVSLSIPEQKKPGLFRRMRELLRLQGTTGLLLATIVLALMANSYELLCTSGLPMVYTRILTLEALPAGQYYLYLLLYNLVYVVPLALIVLLFSMGVARSRLQALGGRLLKLLSGLMMGGLGLVLLLVPEWLNSPATTLLIISLALLLTMVFRLRWKKA